MLWTQLAEKTMSMKVQQRKRGYKRASPPFTVYLEPEEKERAIQAAEKTGETLSAFIRRATRKEAEAVLESAT